MSTWTDFLLKLTRLISGDDANADAVPVSTLQDVIALGERRIYRELRTRHNEKAFSSVTTTSNAATMPTDFECASVVHFGKKALQPVTEEWLREYIENGAIGGDAIYFTHAGNTLMFGPAVADGTTVQGRYYCRLAGLSESTISTNAVYAIADDLFVYAALAESAPFFEQDARIPLWTAKYMAIRDQLNLNDRRAAYEAGRIRVRSSTPVMR